MPTLTHPHLINLMKSLGYSSNEGGVCYGLACMGLQAAMAGEIHTFDNRLNYLATVSPDELTNKVAAARKKVKLHAQLDDETKFLLEIPAFLEGIELYLHTYNYQFLFEKKFFGQSFSMSIPLGLSKKTEKIGIKKIADFVGMYSSSELEKYFFSLEQSIQARQSTITQPLAILISDDGHAVTVVYDPQRHQWLFIDANRLPTRYFVNAHEMTTALSQSFGQSENIALAAEFYLTTTGDDEVKKANYLADWQEKSAWKEMHTITSDKAKLVDLQGGTWLWQAANNNKYETAQELLQADADVNHATNEGRTALHAAAENGHIEMVRLLLEEGAAINHANNEDTTALYIAAQIGSVEMVRLLLEKGAAINHANNRGATALHAAAQLGHLEVVRLLLEHGATIDHATNIIGATALYIAAQLGHIEVVRLFLEKGAAIDHATNIGAIALHAAAERGHAEVVKLLLAHGTAIDHAATKGATALYFAAQNGHIEVVRILLEKAANINQSNQECTPLFTAARCGQVEVVDLLLENNADINKCCPTTVDSLIYLSRINQTESVLEKLFHKKPAQPDGKVAITPQEIAQIMGHTEVVKSLQKATIRAQSQAARKQGVFKRKADQEIEDSVRAIRGSHLV